MKRKRSAAALSGPRWDMLTVVLFSIFLFFAMHLWTEQASVWFAFIALALCVGRTPWRLAGERFCVSVIAFLAFMALYGAAAVYSPFGSSAVRDFRGGLAAFAVAALVLFRLEKRHVRGVLWGIAGVCAVVSLLCTSSACGGPLYEAFLSIMDLFESGTAYVGEIRDIAGRVNGIYNDANVSASILALGTMISLYLAQTGEKWWERLLACVLVSASAVGVLLSVSRGAILCFGLSLVVWLAAVGKGRRLRLFLLMVAAAGVCLLAAVPVMPMVAPGAVLPNLLVLGSGGVIFLLDWAAGDRLLSRLAGHEKGIAVLCGGVAAIIAVFCAAALTVTGPFTFSGRALVRSAVLEPGTYSLSVDGDGLSQVYVYSQSEAEALMNTQQRLYRGAPEDVTFTVPEDAERVFFRFDGEEGNGVLRSAVISDGTELPLRYKLLPEGIAARLHQGLFSGNSFLLRVQYIKDAWKIFCQKPLCGYGLGSTDNLYPAVQPFYYTSRYVHNYLLQTMADQGLLGTVSLLTFLGGCLWLLIKRLRKEQDALAALFAACWVMVNSHSLMEINFSLQAYQCVAFVLLLLPVALYGEPLRIGVAKLSSMAVCAVFLVYLAAFGGLMALRQRVQWESSMLRATSMEELMSALDSYAKRDVFDPAPYEVEYVAAAVSDTSGLYNMKMLEYVEKIRKSGSYPSCAALLENYYLPAGDFVGIFECSRECLLQRASYEAVWNEQMDFYRNEVLSAAGEKNANVFLEGVLEFQALLEEVNSDRVEEIVLTKENQKFVNVALSARDLELSDGILYQYLASGGKSGVET